MMNVKLIQEILSRMADLIRVGGSDSWIRALEHFEREIASSPDATCAEILSAFGGMGSLNDLILYKDGQPLFSENSELDELRSKLYMLCHK